MTQRITGASLQKTSAWLRERDLLIAALAKGPMTSEEIASLLGRTTLRLHRYVERLGIRLLPSISNADEHIGPGRPPRRYFHNRAWRGAA